MKYKFMTCGKIGSTGPTQSDADSTYKEFSVQVDQGIQKWTVPASGIYRIEAAGAAGLNSSQHKGGKGAKLISQFNLSKGETLYILVGQQGIITGPN